MKKTAPLFGYLVVLLLFSCQPERRETTTPVAEETTPSPEKKKRKIKLAILLDTSGSMSGLIEQTKNQLWKMVNQLAKAKDKEGEDPDIELALYQYGNDGLSSSDGYIEQISGFTTELDEISEKLFGLRTNGGSEYCGTVIQGSLAELEWSQNKEDLQIIFIAGNEPFTQGEINYKNACTQANENHVIVNTIFCGNYNQGIEGFWKHGADLGKGKYMNIDHNSKIIHIDSPYDKQITQLNTRFNDTYIPYGKMGWIKKEKQLKEDQNASSYGNANVVKRTISKGSKVYKNYRWDLVDASSQKGFDIKKIDVSSLPKEMQGLSEAEKIQYIKNYRNKRLELKKQISTLNKQRELYVAKVKAKNASGKAHQLDDVIIAAIIEQAQRKAFSFEDEIN